MAREYDVVCLTCGEVWSWCKWDAPDEKCEHCGATLTRKLGKDEEPNWVNGYPDDEDWDYSQVKIYGIGISHAEEDGKEIREDWEADQKRIQEIEGKEKVQFD